jgi:hypothetical protein
LLKLFTHQGTALFVKKMRTTIPQLFDYLFLQDHNFDHVCFCKPGWSQSTNSKDYGIYCTRQQIHFIIYSHIVMRSSVFAAIEAEGWLFKNFWTSKTDAAFLYFVDFFFQGSTQGDLTVKPELHSHLYDIPGKGRVAMIESKKVYRAFSVFTEQPLKFAAQERIGQQLLPVQDVIVTFTPGEVGGDWKTVWQAMSRAEGEIYYPDSNYEYRRF